MNNLFGVHAVLTLRKIILVPCRGELGAVLIIAKRLRMLYVYTPNQQFNMIEISVLRDIIKI